jgi:acyl dehydratase
VTERLSLDLAVGHVVSATKVFTQEEFDRFTCLSGDDNPIHVDAAFAANTRFGRTVAHGMFLYGVICSLLGKHFPEAVQRQQDLIFPAPTFAGEAMNVTARIVAISPDGREIHVRTSITNPQGEVTCEGGTLLELSGD